MTDGGSDDDLIAGINAGDAGAFRVLYFRYRDYVHRLARRFTGHDEDALDVLQETFAYLDRKRPNLTLSAKMTTFLWPVVRNLSLQARRKRRRSLAVGDADLDTLPAAEGPGDDALDAVLGRLSPEHRQVVLMRFADDLSLADIAALLGLPLGTVKSRLHHALAILREDPRTRSLLD